MKETDIGMADFADLLARICPEVFEEGRGVTPKGLRPRCGAKCRDGHPCQAPAVWDKKNDRPRNGRCRMHGGLSTGPKTPEGKLRALMKLKQFQARPQTLIRSILGA